MSVTKLNVEGNKKADSVIIGGGVVGLSIACYTALEGASVILLEQNRIPSGSSYGNAGMLVPNRYPPHDAWRVSGRPIYSCCREIH